MDLEQLKPVLQQIGFDPALLAHAVGTMAIFRFLAMPLAKMFDFIPRRFETFVAFVVCITLDVLASLFLSHAALMPTISSAAVGAVIAMVAWDMQHKREGAPLSDKAYDELKERLRVEDERRARGGGTGGPTTPVAT